MDNRSRQPPSASPYLAGVAISSQVGGAIFARQTLSSVLQRPLIGDSESTSQKAGREERVEESMIEVVVAGSSGVDNRRFGAINAQRSQGGQR